MRRGDAGEYHYAFEFEPGQYPARGALARAIFAGRYPVAGVVRSAWPDLLRQEIAGLSRRFRGRRLSLDRPAAVPVPVATPRPSDLLSGAS
jgi:hypothetical protein